MSKKKILDDKYYIKKDGEVLQVTKEEYDEFVKDNKKQFICKDCKISNCNRIITRNISTSPEVISGASNIKKTREVIPTKKPKSLDIQTDELEKNIVRIYDDISFYIFECRTYTPYKEVAISRINAINSQIDYLNRELVKETSEDRISKIEANIKDLQDQKDKLSRLLDEKTLEKLNEKKSRVNKSYYKKRCLTEEERQQIASDMNQKAKEKKLINSKK